MRKFKVMLIDDSKTIFKTAKMFLSEEEYELIHVENGFEALAQIMETMPDVILLDVLMPKLDGLQTCQLLKRNDELKHIPIIFLSSKDGEFDKARGNIAGANDYLTKPFKKETINEMLKKHTENLIN